MAGSTEGRRRIRSVLLVASLVLALLAIPPRAGAATFDSLPETPAGSYGPFLGGADGRYVARSNTEHALQLHGYLADGTPDPAFGVDGVATIPADHPHDSRVARRTDGSFAVSLAQDDGIEYLRLLANGALDATYGEGGSIGPGEKTDTWGEVGADGAVYLLEQTGPQTIEVTKHGPDGRLDPTYRADGLPAVESFADLVIRGDGRLVMVTQRPEQRLVRLGPGGELEATSPLLDPALSLAVFDHPAGEGTLLRDSYSTRFRRLGPDLAVDGEFGGAGSVTLAGRDLRDVAEVGERTYLATTTSTAGSKPRLWLHALDGDGFDEAFGGTGTVEISLPAGLDGPILGVSAHLAVDEHGGAVVSAQLTSGRSSDLVDETARLYQFASDGRLLVTHGAPGIAYPEVLPGRDAVLAWVRTARHPLLGDEPAVIGRFALVDPSLAAPPFRSAPEFARRLIEDLYDRAATPAEVLQISARIGAGESTAAVARWAVQQPSWAEQVEPVVRLYHAYFRRLPDPSGLDYWLRRRSAGEGVARISAVFAASSEFVRTYGPLDDRAFVELVYRNVLDRAGDPAGIAFWTGRVERGVTTRGHLMASFSESSEHVRLRAPMVGTVGLFRALLDRPPTPTELADWTGTLPVGDADALARWLLASGEYRARAVPAP